MTCQLFDGTYGCTSGSQSKKPSKYAADNGAVILQCSWGYNSPDANEALGYTPRTERRAGLGKTSIRWKRKHWITSSTMPVHPTDSRWFGYLYFR